MRWVWGQGLSLGLGALVGTQSSSAVRAGCCAAARVGAVMHWRCPYTRGHCEITDGERKIHRVSRAGERPQLGGGMEAANNESEPSQHRVRVTLEY